jgi:hypothetical protein
VPLPASASSLTRRRDAGALGSWKEGGRGRGGVLGNWGWGCVGGGKKRGREVAEWVPPRVGWCMGEK